MPNWQVGAAAKFGRGLGSHAARELGFGEIYFWVRQFIWGVLRDPFGCHVNSFGRAG